MPTPPYRPLSHAVICAGLRGHNKTLEWLGKVYEEHDPMLLWLKVDPRLDRVSVDARFQDLTRREGLPYSERENVRSKSANPA